MCAQASKILVGGAAAYNYLSLLEGMMLGAEDSLAKLSDMSDPWHVEVPGLLDGPGRCSMWRYTPPCVRVKRMLIATKDRSMP